MSNAKLPKPTVCKLSDITLGDRIREDLGDIDQLAESIKVNGLISPLLLRWPDRTLIAGGRRYTALTKLGWKEVPVYYRHEITDSQLRLLELEENVRRKSMTWKEQCLAIAEVHELHSKDAHKESLKWTYIQTGDLLGVSHGNVNYCVTMAKHIRANDEAVLACDTLRDAMRVLMKRQEDSAIKLLANLSLGKAVEVIHPNLDVSKDDEYEIDNFADLPPEEEELIDLRPQPLKDLESVRAEARLEPNPDSPLPAARRMRVHLSRLLHNTDCLEYMTNNKHFCNHILTDIPYGIEMNNLQQSNGGMDVSRVRHTHDVDENVDQIKRFGQLAYDAIFDRGGFLCVWYDLQHHQLLYDTLVDVGFKVQRWPIVWDKHHTCSNQAAQFNFTKRTEFCMIARKGNATLIEQQPTNIVSANALEYKHLFGDHPFIKPPECWEFLMNAVSYPGQIIFDPFAGVGSSLYTFIRHGRKFVACEIDEKHYNNLKVSTQQWLEGMLGDIEFV